MVQVGACICCFQRTIYPKIGLYNKLNVFSSYFSETYAPAQALAPQSKFSASEYLLRFISWEDRPLPYGPSISLFHVFFLGGGLFFAKSYVAVIPEGISLHRILCRPKAEILEHHIPTAFPFVLIFQMIITHK